MLLVFAVATTWAPWRRPGWKTPSRGLWVEGVALVTAVVAALQLARLAVPTRDGMAWGRVAFYAAAYWYACAGGMAIVRLVLDMVPVSPQPPKGGIAVSASELARGRMIGVLERALALTLVLLGQYGALGLLIAAKALARFRALEDRDFAEYFLIGTLASLLHALVVGVGVRLLT
ncbi:MAG: hypothetical protein HYW52_02930 [Gemmatimonadetes bacterium]|nr:hypothetical protein [Gemmatimonadota bacterium]